MPRSSLPPPVEGELSERELYESLNSPLSAAGEQGGGNTLSAAYAINADWQPRPENNAELRKTAHLIYFKMCEDPNCRRHYSLEDGKNHSTGWITVGPDRLSNPPEHTRYIDDKHMTPLPQYGRMAYGVHGANNPRLRFRQILEHPSGKGIFEFPASQMAALGWDKIPEVVALRPELGQIRRIACEHGCSERDFLTDVELKKHIQASHPEVVSTIAIGKALHGAQAPASTDPAALAAAIVAVLDQIQQQATE